MTSPPLAALFAAIPPNAMPGPFRPLPPDPTIGPLATAWFVILTVLVGGYAVLDGFDLGVGILQPFVPRDESERRTTIAAIGPLWDGNEVWLVTFGGSLFAMFPSAYASIFGAFYLPFMLVLWALILRAASVELRVRARRPWTRRVLDGCFFTGSGGATLLFGVAVGNALRGIPLDARGTFTGTVFDLFTPYCLMTGATAVAMFAMHGAIYLSLKTDGDLRRRLRGVTRATWVLFLLLFVTCTVWTLVGIPRATLHLWAHRWMSVAALANVVAVASVGRCVVRDRVRAAFAGSGATVLTFVLLAGATAFPNMVTATDPRHSLTVYQAASSPKTLTIGLVIVAIGVPLVATYTGIIYWTFRGKARPV